MSDDNEEDKYSDKTPLSPRRPSMGSKTVNVIDNPPGIADTNSYNDIESKSVEMTKTRYRGLSCETSLEGKDVRKKSSIKKRGSYGAMQMKKILSQENGENNQGTNFVTSKVFNMVREGNMSMIHLAALTTAKNRLKKDQDKSLQKYGNFVLIPGTKMFAAWDIIVIVSIIFTVIYAPLQIVFPEPYGKSGSVAFYIRFIADRMIDIVFLMDVALSFRTARVTSGGSITFDAEETKKKYLRGRFVFDLIVAWPWDMIVFAIKGDLNEGQTGTALWLRIPRLIKIFRLNRFMSISERWEHHIKLSYRATNGLFVFGFYLLVIHLVACCWILASGIYDESDSWVDTLAPADVAKQYSIAVYWAITTLTTIGYGDVTPVLGNNLEMWFTVFVMFCGAMCYAFVVGKITEYVGSKHAARSHFELNVQNLKSYMKYFPNLPSDLKDRIYRYCLYIRQTEKVKYKRSGLKLLSPALRQELALFCHIEIMSESPLFNAVGTSIVAEASTLLKPVLYGPDEIVVCAGDVCKQMFFVSDGAMLRETCRGRVNVINRDKQISDPSRVLAKLTDRLCFGDGNIVFQRASQRETIVTLTFTNLLVLSREDMMPIWYRNPNDWEEAKSALARCLWREILSSGAFTNKAGLKTTSSWRTLARSPARKTFRVISKGGSPHYHKASKLLSSHEKRRRASTQHRLSSRRSTKTSPASSLPRKSSKRFSPSPSHSYASSLSPRSPRRDFRVLNQKCDQILDVLSSLNARIAKLEIESDFPPPPPKISFTPKS